MPELTAVTEFIVNVTLVSPAIGLASLYHWIELPVPQLVKLAVRVRVLPSHKELSFASTVTDGDFTVNVAGFSTPPQNPPSSVVVALMVVVPAALIVIAPVELFIVATLVLVDDQVTVGLSFPIIDAVTPVQPTATSDSDKETEKSGVEQDAK